MKNKTLQQWLDEMDKLDAEATKGPWHTKLDYEDFIYAPDAVAIGQIFLTNPAQTKDTKFVLVARTELPRALRVIKYLYAQLMEAEDYILVESWTGDAEYWEALQKMRNHHLKEIEKILNEEVG